jgi:hypothetical protein
VVVDLENPLRVRFYNLEGESYSSNFQAEFNYNLFEHVDLRLAYKYYDVQTDYLEGRKLKPLTPQHRFFANIAFETHQKPNGANWKFDATFNYLGEQRFSSDDTYLNTIGLSQFSASVSTLNAQITRVFSPKFEVYVGGENITNVMQENPVVSGDNPFGSNFDTSYVYGPIFGSAYYAGLRYRIN